MMTATVQTRFLDVERDGNIVCSIALNSGVIRIGRAPDNDLTLEHLGVSKHHVELSVTPAGLVVTDLGSANGTFINGSRVLAAQPTFLDAGQWLQIGPFMLSARRSPADEPAASQSDLLASPDNARVDGTDHVDGRTAAPPIPARRPTLPMPLSESGRSHYLNYLPSMFDGNDFFGRFLLIFESIW